MNQTLMALTPSSPSYRRGMRQRFMAWLLAANGGRMHRMFGASKQQLLEPLHGDLLEVGPGAGANFRYFSAGAVWHGVEPNLHNLAPLRAEAARWGHEIAVQPGYAEALPYPDATFDHVVTTLVLCSVQDVAASLAEVRRVLKPGGSYVFFEHVAAPPHTLTRWLQDVLEPAWGFLADGCHPNRELGEAIGASGLAVERMEHFDVSLPLVRPHIAGTARKA